MNQFRQVRLKLKWSIRQAAIALHTPERTVYRWDAGTAPGVAIVAIEGKSLISDAKRLAEEKRGNI